MPTLELILAVMVVILVCGFLRLPLIKKLMILAINLWVFAAMVMVC